MTQTRTPTQKTSLPLLPGRRSAEASHDALQELRRFHLAPPVEPASAGTVYRPALLDPWRLQSRGRYPLLLAPPEGGEAASCPPLADVLSQAAPEDGDISRAAIDDLADRVRDLASESQVPADARALFDEAIRGLADGGMPTDGLDRLAAALPAAASLLPLGEQTPLHLLMHAAGGLLSPARSAFREEVRALAAEAEALLAADRQRRPESRTSDTVGDSLGKLGSRFLDPSALAGVLDARSGGTVLSAERKQRLEEAHAELETYAAAAEAPALILVHDGAHGIPGLPAGETDRAALEAGAWRVELHEDPCAAAAEIFDREAERLARVLRASRRIRLEADGKYDPERQDPWLERFDWQAFSRRELLLLAPVVALVAADRVAGPGMVAFSSLLRSGRRVQVLVPLAPAVNPGAGTGAGAGAGAEVSAEDGLAGFRFEPAYLGLSHREAFVQQTSAAEPAHMLQGFLRALAATHAGLHVVSSGQPSASAEVYAKAVLEARAHPLFHYDPETGPSWAERLDFSLNPQAGIDWPLHALETRRPDGSRETLELAFTFADFALLEPAYRRHFRAVPDGVPDVELVPVAEYLDGSSDEAAIPFVWAVDDASTLVRLAISRPLALACRDRLDFWRILQELSGVRSEHVRRAEARLRRELEGRVAEERAALEARHAEELERVRRDASRDVVDRLTAALFEVDLATFAPAAPAAGPLAGLSGDVDSVAAALLEIADVGSLDQPAEAGAGEGVEKMAADLLDLVKDRP